MVDEILNNDVVNELNKTGRTWNDAVSYTTPGVDELSNNFGYWFKAGTYTNRSQDAVDVDMSKIFSENPHVALQTLFGVRLISRKPNLPDIEESQTGYGRRDEFYKGVVWLNQNYPHFLYANLHLIPVFGSWKDFFNLPLIDVLDRQKVFELCRNNLNDDLLLKYLPQLRSKSNLRTERDKIRSNWAKEFMFFLRLNPGEYRRLKSKGCAHIWQKQMTRGDWDNINFNGIPGRAMFLHTSQKGRKDKLTVFERHGQVDRLIKWVEEQNTIKFTGYPYELLKAALKHPALVQKIIYNKQFESLISSIKDCKLGNVLCCLDTSGSMTWDVIGGITAYEICISMGITFSCLNMGYFKDMVVAFSDRSELFQLKGSFCDRAVQIANEMGIAWGSTNFQSVIDLLVNIRKRKPEIPVSQYPETLLIISDMQFNPVRGNTQTNYEVAIKKLRSVGLEDVRIIWWTVNGAPTDFPSTMDAKGVYMCGGFDPVNLKTLLGLSSEKKEFKASEKKEEDPKAGYLNFLNQPIFSLLRTE